jgi:hypothetical protein
VELQTQLPLLQIEPELQIALLPHLQTPEAQLSARVELQLVQVAPPAPHEVVVVPAEQVLPLQQPLAQLVESQTQLPPELHRWPAEQAEFEPQRQLPLEEQLLAVVLLQAAQLAAPVPHEVSVGGLTQLPLLQQPAAQLVESQTQLPPTQ